MIIVVQVGAVKIFIVAMEVFKKKKRQGETQISQKLMVF
jgi:hypothetical protein